MQKRIRELAEGRVECVGPAVEFSVGRIEMEVLKDQDIKGEFTIISKNRVPMSGMVYASNPRMECVTCHFEGEEARIRYEFHSMGLMEGDIQKGDFFVVCSQGEYNLSFVAVILKPYVDAGMGRIRNLADFAKLSQEHWEKARKLFYSPSFQKIIKAKEVRERLLYEGTVKGVQADKSLEEFLLACGLKEEIIIKADQRQILIEQSEETVSQSVTVTKNTWGYIELKIESDAAFIRPAKRKIVTEDFLGREAKIWFYLERKKMHAGNNYGCLILKDMHQEIRIQICGKLPKEGELKAGQEGRKKKQLLKKLLETYVDYRLKVIVTGRWASVTCQVLSDLILIEPKNAWYHLYKAQAFLLNGQRQEAEWILNDFKRKWRDKKSPEWGYYLYICTLMEHEALYIDRLTEEFEQIYLEHAENEVLFWCLVFLREDYADNRYQKLKALEERIMGGVDSPALYVEAYNLFLAEPYLISRLEPFEIKILNWARKRHMLTKALAEQMLSVFPERLSYHKILFLLLEEGSKLIEDERMLSAVCGYLIRNQKYGAEFFPWYEKGIENKLRITGLYEAYLMSMDARSVQEVPKIIQMYFKYNNQLGYRQKAVLYVNIIASKMRNPKVYEQHYPAMEQFACEQMKQRRIDDNLAVIYEDVLSHGIYFPEITDALSDILFVHRLTCLEEDAIRVVILQDQLKTPTIVPLVNGVAYFSLYSNDYGILIEDRYGNRYGSSIPYQLEKLMYPGKYLRACMKFSPGKLPFLLHYFANRKALDIFEETDFPYVQTVMASNEVSRAYKAELFPKMFRLLFLLDQTEEMRRELNSVDFSLMSPKERGYILEICIDRQLYKEACQIAMKYGFEQIPSSAKVRLASNRIHRMEFAEDKNLLYLCVDVFLAGKYNDAVLEYLCRYYQGPGKIMAAIFKSAKDFHIDAKRLAERILVQMLYTSEFLDCVDEIYQSYEEGGHPMVKEAYLTYFSYYSFVRGIFPPDGFYENLRNFRPEGQMNEACELALLKYYASNPGLVEADAIRAEALLKKYVQEGVYFAFYKNFNAKLAQKYQFYDKYFIEYSTKKQSRVQIFCKKRDTEEGYTAEEMTEMYEGIYVKKMVLFLGEAVQYYISEEINGQMEATESGLLECGQKTDCLPESRFGRLNEMIGLQKEGKEEELAARMQEYEQLDVETEKAFTILY